MPFRFQNQRALLTYKYHLDKNQVTDFFNDLAEVDRIEIAHETGDETNNYDHTHVVIAFKKVFQTRNERKFDIDVDSMDIEESVIHPHIRKLLNIKAFNDALVYISKEDPECAHLKKIDSIVETIWKSDTTGEALAACTDLRNVSSIIQAMQFKPREPEVKNIDWIHEWQADLAQYLDRTEPDYRKVFWYYDPNGGAGKSLFCRKYYQEHPKEAVIFTQFGGQKDAACVMKNFVESGGQPRTVLVDLARSFEDRNYAEPIEAIKNGMLTNLKYQGGMVYFDVPHLVIFANFRPKVAELSLDRWVIRKFHSETDIRDIDARALLQVQMEKAKNKVVYDNKQGKFVNANC